MNSITVATHTSHITHLSPPEWSLSRSKTEPLTESAEGSHKARSSVDGVPRHPTLERGISLFSSSSSRPQQKRRSTTLHSIPTRKSHSRKDSGLSKSPSVPTFHTKSDSRDSKSALAVSAAESSLVIAPAPLLRVPSNASTTDSRSPSVRRAPASHSSYGVETSNGPPPSFTTQRTLSQDRLWKPLPPEKSNIVPKVNVGQFHGESGSHPMDMDEDGKRQDAGSSQEELDSMDTPTKRIDESANSHGTETEGPLDGHSMETLCDNREQLIQGLDVPSADEGSKNSGSDDRKSEDVFLNIAHTDAGGQAMISRSERRKSRIGTFYTSSITRPSNEPRNEETLQGEEKHANEATLSPHTEVPYQQNKRHSFGFRSIAVSATPLDDSARQRYFSAGTRTHTIAAPSSVGRADRETSPELPQNTSHRATNLDTGNRSYRRSNLSAFRSDRVVPSAEAQERPRYVEQNIPRIEGTDSTMSTTAPSTVWDELDELKSRIRKLELTGKLPASSAAAMSTAERPQTATTTVTTMSSSPKHGKATISALEAAVEGVPATVHPLLHEALRKARPVLSADVYQKLETTASDALQLASAMGAGLQSGNISTIGGSSSTERQLRRRADSMCRGLTELTIALSARPKSPTSLQSFRPSSRDGGSTFGQTPPMTSYSMDSNTRFNRHLSNDPDDPRPPMKSRVQSRLETRRASLLHNSVISSPPEHASPDITVHTPTSAHAQSQMQPASSSRLNRAASRLRGRRATGAGDGADDSDNDNSPSVRPVSRARTDVSLRNRSARDRTSLGREYTSSHPLPSFVRKGDDPATQRSPSVTTGSGLPTRRQYNSPNVNGGSSGLNSPATPKDNIQPSYRRYVSSGVGRESSPYLSSAEHTPENVTVQRGSASASRRSLAFTSRLGQVGSFVNGRLRAAKTERERQENLQGQEKALVLHVSHDQSGDGQENQAAY